MPISVMVCNRTEAEQAKLHDGTAVISIHTPGDEPADIKHHKDLVLHLCFSDIADPRVCARLEEENKKDPTFKVTMFSDQQAQDVLDFVEKCTARGVFHFLVHCDAGISRSPGVAVALNQIYNDDRSVPYRYQLFNKWVYTKLLTIRNLPAFETTTNLANHPIKFT